MIQRSRNTSKDHVGLLSHLRMLSQNKVSLNHFPSDIDADIYRAKLNLDWLEKNKIGFIFYVWRKRL